MNAARSPCYIVPQIGGWCGECNGDTDCPDAGGCALPDPIHKLGSTECSDGTYNDDDHKAYAKSCN